VLFLYGFLRLQGHLVQMAGVAVQNFVSAAVGIAVAFALVRGLARASSTTLGNFWVDLVRITLRVLLPLSFVAAVVLIACGAVQNLSGGVDVTTLAGGTQHLTGGPVASQEAIKELGTNGGGFSNANSARPYENPTSVSNWFEVLLIHGAARGDQRRPAQRLPRAPVRHRTDGGRRRPRGHGDAVRRRPVGDVRGRHHAHLDRRGQLLPRLLPRRGRGRRDAQHDARRGRSGRRRLRPLRAPGPRDHHGLRGRADGRPDARVRRQEDRRAGDGARLAVLPGDADARARRDGRSHSLVVGAEVDAPRRPARALPARRPAPRTR